MLDTFSGTLDVRELIGDHPLLIFQADPRVAVSSRLLDLFRRMPGVSQGGDVLTIVGVGRDDQPCQATYRVVGFDPTNHPEANEGGFHLLERAEAPEETW